MLAASNPPSTRNAESRTSIKRLTREHFALYRGYLDGVSVEQLHATYGDATTIRRTENLPVLELKIPTFSLRREENSLVHNISANERTNIPLIQRVYGGVVQIVLDVYNRIGSS